MIVRPALPGDAAAMQAIYGHHVLHGSGTFEEEPPTVAEMEARMDAVLRRGLPYLVAEIEGQLAGFAYAGPFRLRAAYRFTAEDSVYIHPDRIGRGVGRRLLETVIGLCERAGLHQLLAVIGDSANAGSIGLHRACGFELIGTTPGLGFKHGRWVDVVWMQRALNGGDRAAPTADGLDLSAG
jgi:phosphinothricin acetyltransferase